MVLDSELHLDIKKVVEAGLVKTILLKYFVQFAQLGEIFLFLMVVLSKLVPLVVVTLMLSIFVIVTNNQLCNFRIFFIIAYSLALIV